MFIETNYIKLHIICTPKTIKKNNTIGICIPMTAPVPFQPFANTSYLVRVYLYDS